MFNPNQSIPTGAKVEIGPMGFTLGVKAEIEKKNSMCAKLLINDEVYGLVLAQRPKEILQFNLRGQFAYKLCPKQHLC
jgi:sulfur relay (sulfurtransferase) DsrF/TusC family protein